jgi:hypothetical protein
VNDLTKIKPLLPSIESESLTPVQFLPSEMLAWRAPIMTRRRPAEPRPEPARKALDTAR